MPTTLLIVYRVLGTVLFALAAAAIVEKYRTVRGAALLPARVLECRRASSTSNSRGAGGYRYLVELYANGRRLELETNDAFWFRHDKDKGKVLQVWYNPNARCVERKSWETEFFAAVLAVIGAALLLCRPLLVGRRLHGGVVREGHGDRLFERQGLSRLLCREGERRGHRCRQAGDPENVFHSDHCVCGTNIWDLSGTLRQIGTLGHY